MWEELIGRRSSPVTNWVERGAVRKFAEAIDDLNPLYFDEQAARASSHGRLIAPPTFPVILDHGAIEGLVLPVAGLLHGEQRFEYRRPLYVGETISCWTTLENAYEKRGKQGLLTFLVLARTAEDEEGRHIYTMSSTLIVTEAVRERTGA
ncbi:MAG TPA: MaoC family dehydratase N-terminal domain-containing protein [Chloroflexota bacterium]|nr:MaoC family dehydratase N-terminal domain-containing protein [Chloroflexota bacterium]